MSVREEWGVSVRGGMGGECAVKAQLSGLQCVETVKCSTSRLTTCVETVGPCVSKYGCTCMDFFFFFNIKLYLKRARRYRHQQREKRVQLVLHVLTLRPEEEYADAQCRCEEG